MTEVVPQPPAPDQPAPQPIGANIKETIESILVAFILAFIFRAFVVEAFVIPTGSMAPTLLGAHQRFRCPDCGYVFDINYPSRSDSDDDMSFPSDSQPPAGVYCPNCGYHVANGPLTDRYGQFVDLQDKRSSDPHWPYGTPMQPVGYGDRILVLKYAYLFNEPRRWDVVVFKAPDRPEQFHYTMNYIKRLVGKPGETLMVLDGSVYLKDAQGQWQIQQRPHSAQEALWRIVYDNDYYPQGLPRPDRDKTWIQPWETPAASGWNLGHNGADGRAFRYTGQGQGAITYDADANRGSQTINDYLIYDVPNNVRRPDVNDAGFEDRDRNIVSDLKLAAWYQRQDGAGPLNLRLTKREDAFVAQIDGQSVTLLHTRPDKTTVIDAGPIKLTDLGLQTGSPMWLEFSNVDYRVSLRINGNEVLATTPRQYAPDVPQLMREYAEQLPPAERIRPQIQIIANSQSCTLSHLGLWRNVYYTNRSNNAPLTWATPDHPIHLHRRGETRPNNAGVYGEDEYFVMGDNSLISGDARYWNEPIDLPNEQLKVDSGRVPARFLLGRAFFVYWPAGYRPVPGWLSIIPDFGDMRFIH